MEIIVGKTAGFCHGVKRAVEGTKQELAKYSKKVYCLGEIVHNKQVIEELEEEGLTIIEKWQEAKGKIIIRAHGVAKTIEQEMRQAKLIVKDYTCPKVKAIHQLAEQYSQNGYYVFLLGTRNHPENLGTISYCQNQFTVIEEETEVDKAIQELKQLPYHKLLVIAQTTYSYAKFEKIKIMIEQQIGHEIEVVIKNTICKATELRQKETAELTKQVDQMIIVGGKNSSNTRKIYEIAKQENEQTIWVETEKELEGICIEGEKIGIMAGASTPSSSIEKVINKIRESQLIHA